MSCTRLWKAVEGHLEGRRLLCGLRKYPNLCPVAVGMLVCGYQEVDELGQEKELCGNLVEKRRLHKTHIQGGFRSASDKWSPTLDTLRLGQIWLA